MINNKNWFTADKIDDNTYIVSENHHWEETHCYLLCGNKKALFIDTGLGICNIFDEVKKLTDKPIIAFPTHIHWDHIGGLEYFSEFGVHNAEREWIEEKFPMPREIVIKELIKNDTIPDDFDADSYKIFCGKANFIFNEDAEIDLGGRKISVLHTTGHSPGHMCFYEKKTGYLFSGDLIYKGILFANYPSTDPVAYLDSLKKIEKLSVKRIFPAHHSLDITPEIILEMINELQILKDKGLLCHKSGIFNYKDWSISL